MNRDDRWTLLNRRLDGDLPGRRDGEPAGNPDGAPEADAGATDEAAVVERALRDDPGARRELADLEMISGFVRVPVEPDPFFLTRHRARRAALGAPAATPPAWAVRLRVALGLAGTALRFGAAAVLAVAAVILLILPTPTTSDAPLADAGANGATVGAMDEATVGPASGLPVGLEGDVADAVLGLPAAWGAVAAEPEAFAAEPVLQIALGSAFESPPIPTTDPSGPSGPSMQPGRNGR